MLSPQVPSAVRVRRRVRIAPRNVRILCEAGKRKVLGLACGKKLIGKCRSNTILEWSVTKWLR